MLYHLTACRHDLIHILRFMMSWSGEGVLDRTWRFECLYAEIIHPPYRGTMPPEYEPFPELGPDFLPDRPFEVSGTRLVERAALIRSPEAILVRLSDSSSEGFDLKILMDDGHRTLIETNDEPLSTRLEEWFRRTSDELHSDCFI